MIFDLLRKDLCLLKKIWGVPRWLQQKFYAEKISTRGDFFLISIVSGKFWFGRIHADLWIHIKNFSEILNPKSESVNLYLMIAFKIAIYFQV